MQKSSKTIWLWLVVNTFRWLWIGFLVGCSREMLMTLLLSVHLIIMLLFCNSENIIGLIERGLVNLCQLFRFVNFFWNEDLPARRKERTCALLGDICRMIGKPSLIPTPGLPPSPLSVLWEHLVLARLLPVVPLAGVYVQGASCLLCPRLPAQHPLQSRGAVKTSVSPPLATRRVLS